MLSTLYYHSFSFSSRFLSQRSNQEVSLDLTVSLLTSLNGTRGLEDMGILNSFRHIELLSGKKPCLVYFGSRYVGTTKKSFSLLKVNLRSVTAYTFLEGMATLLLPNYQKRVGRFLSSSVAPSGITINCTDLQLFNGYVPNFVSDPILIKVRSCNHPVTKTFIDMLYLYKFNFVQ